MVQQLGAGAHLIKMDIQSAFRLLPLHPDDYCLMGMSHEGEYFVDKALPFGCAISCALFEQFSTFLEWCAKTLTRSENLIHYLDDFCGGAHAKDEAGGLLEGILQLFKQLGVPVAPDKVEGPTTCLKFLGLIVDTVAMEVRIPEEKVTDLLGEVTGLLGGKKKVTLRQLQSLIGKLNFACRAIVPGRPFCRRLINTTCGVTNPHHRIRVTNAMIEDLKIWEQFLRECNGRSIMLHRQWLESQALELFTGAAGSVGFGAYLQGHWSHGTWPPHWQQNGPDITFKELFAIVLAVHLWANLLTNKKIIFHCDNQAVVTIINKQSTRSPPSMQLVRIMVLTCLRNNLLFKARHIPGARNCIADALSRGQLTRFQSLASTADSNPATIPESLKQLLQLK